MKRFAPQIVECDGWCYLNLCKPFGTVSHDSLVVKLVEVWTGWVNYMVGEKLADTGEGAV